jgi:hypothetical protein
MKKLFFSAYVIVAIALVPAVVFGYLHNNGSSNKQSIELAKDVVSSQESSSILRLVKSF